MPRRMLDSGPGSYAWYRGLWVECFGLRVLGIKFYCSGIRVDMKFACTYSVAVAIGAYSVHHSITRELHLA